MTIMSDSYAPNFSSDVHYGYDVNVAKHLGIDGFDPSSVLNYNGMAKHYVAANNLHALKSLVEIKDPPQLSVKTAAGVDEDGDLDVIDAESTKNQEEVDEVMSALEDQSLAPIIKEDPSISRKYLNLAGDLDDMDNPRYPAFEMMGHALGLNNPRGVHDASMHPTFIKDLQGKADRSAHNDAGWDSLREGINRAVNLMTRHKSYNQKLIGEPDEFVDNMVLYLSNESNMRKMLEAYRKAGNFRHVGENGKALGRAKPRNDRYVELGFPHVDPNLSTEGNAAARGLHSDIDAYMRSHMENPDDRDKIRVMILEASWVKNVRPLGDGTNAAVILKIGSKEYLKPSQLENNSETESTVKMASSVTEATDFLNEHYINIQTGSRGPAQSILEDTIVKWAAYNVLEGTQGIFKTPMGLILPNKISKKNTEVERTEERKDYDALISWIQSRPRTEPDEKVAVIVDSLVRAFKPLAQKYAEDIDHLFTAVNIRDTSTDGAMLKALIKNFYNQLPHVFVKMLHEPWPSNINEWVTGAMQESVVSHKDFNARIYDLVRSLVNSKEYSARNGEQWVEILENYNMDPHASGLVSMVKSLGEELEQAGKTELGAKIIKGSLEIAHDLVQKVIHPCLLNGAVTKQISAFVEKALKSESGSISMAVPSATKVKRLNENSRPGGLHPFAYLVYVTGEIPIDEDMRKITPIPGHTYDLCVGPKSRWSGGSVKKSKKGPPSEEDLAISMNMGGYILKVYDGRKVVTEEEAMLSSSEIPRFTEFATKVYISDYLSDTPIAASYAAGTTEDGNLEDIISELDNEAHQVLTSNMKDPLFETSVAKLVKGKSTEEITKIFRAINLNKANALKAYLEDHFGEELSIDEQGNLSKGVGNHIRSMREDEDAPFHDSTDSKIAAIIKALGKNKKSLEGYDPTGKSTSKVLEDVRDSKEVSDEFLNNILRTDVALDYKAHRSLMKSMLENAMRTVIKRFNLGHFMEQAESVTNSQRHIKGSVVTNRISKMVKDANARNSNNGSHEEKYIKVWEDARKKDPELFDNLFKPDNTFVHTSTTEGNVTTLLEILANEMKSPEKTHGFLDCMRKTNTNGITVWEPMDTDSEGQKVLAETKMRLANDLIAHNENEAMEILKENGVLDTYIPKKNRNGASVCYAVREDADPDLLLTFMKEHDKVGDVGNLISVDSKQTWYNIKNGVSSYHVKYTKAKDTNLEDTVNPSDSTKARSWNRRMSVYMEQMLDSYKDGIDVNPDVGSLLNDGKDFNKALHYSNAYSQKITGTNDLTKALTLELKGADASLKSSQDSQDARLEGASTQGKAYDKKIDYTSEEVRVDRKFKRLSKWLTENNSLREQDRIKTLLGQVFLTADGTQKMVKDPYLDSPENHKVLIKLIDSESIRPTKGFRR